MGGKRTLMSEQDCGFSLARHHLSNVTLEHLNRRIACPERGSDSLPRLGVDSDFHAAGQFAQAVLWADFNANNQIVAVTLLEASPEGERIFGAYGIDRQ